MGVKVSDLTTESAPASTDLLIIADPTTGAARKITVSALKTFMDGLGGGGDTTAPVIVSATASTASTITIVFSESVTVTTAGWSFKKNGVDWPISSVTGSGNTWTFTMSTSGVSTDTLLRSYSSTTGVTVDTSANELVTFTDQSVTNSIPAGGYQAESDAFFAVNTGLTTTEKDAIDDLVVALKAIGWTKFKAVYPLIGATASAHKWNLINPADTDGAFRITFNGSVTHDAEGITFGGTPSDYGNTHLNPSTALTSLNTHMSCRITDPSYSGTVMGCITNGGDPSFRLIPYTSGDNYYMEMNGTTNGQGRITGGTATGYGFNVITRTSATVFKYFKDGSQVGSTATTTESNGLVNANIYIGAENDTVAGVQNVNGHQINFLSIGAGLSDSDVSAFTAAELAFQTAIGRTIV